MCSKVYWWPVFLTGLLLSCKTDCEEKDSRIYNKWSDSNLKYYFYENNTYGLKYLRAELNPMDTITNTDSAFGVLTFTPCKKFMTLEQMGRKPRGVDTILFKKINVGTWDIEFPNDSVLKYRSQSSIGQFFRVKD